MKTLLTSEELVKHMQDKGITFKYDELIEAQLYMEQSNYYMKLASYRTNYKKYNSGPKEGQYIGLDFAALKELSVLDMHIRYVATQMALDIEHFLKVRLLKEIENNPDEDGYNLIQRFISKDKNFSTLKSIQSHKYSAYCKDLIEKYYPYFPAWVFVELISFGELAYLCQFYKETYDVEIGDRILLNSVRDIRNACAHSNCLINNLIPGNNKAHQSVVDRVKRIDGISENSRDKKLSNKCVYDFVCLLFAYDEIVSNKAARVKRFHELKDLFEGRMIDKKELLLNNNSVTSAYYFIKKLIDSFCDRC